VSGSAPPDDGEDFSTVGSGPTHDSSGRRTRLPVRTAITAAFLLTIGVVFSSIGLATVFTKGVSEAIPFLTIGAIGFLPGSYASIMLWRAYRGYPGYSYEMIPSYDD